MFLTLKRLFDRRLSHLRCHSWALPYTVYHTKYSKRNCDGLIVSDMFQILIWFTFISSLNFGSEFMVLNQYSYQTTVSHFYSTPSHTLYWFTSLQLSVPTLTLFPLLNLTSCKYFLTIEGKGLFDIFLSDEGNLYVITLYYIRQDTPARCFYATLLWRNWFSVMSHIISKGSKG